MAHLRTLVAPGRQCLHRPGDCPGTYDDVVELDRGENLYSSSLHLTNLLDAVCRWRVNRGLLTLVLGIVGTVFSILGVLEHIVPFLLILGIIAPPVGGVMIADYFLLRRDRQELAATRGTATLPASCELLNPVAILAWLAGSLLGYWIPLAFRR